MKMDFVALSLIGVGVALGILAGCIYYTFYNIAQEIQYDITIMKEDINSVQVRLAHIKDFLENS